ncbi:peptide chain release factor N(5)-glutamine methyltransferase [Enterovirga sp. DB1703]|uniref:Release factor glutamine methyltransferase n=2 Tax=Enterovirga aerilata TaxID=2730920 RepID=A0A849I3M0_9HYPH|nr:peptide chain release factor N(5)-glutamine methyltransferase [Enterovirga sp. DB1703]
MTRAAAQAGLRRALTAAGIASAALDARLLVAAALGIGATAFLAHPDERLTAEQAARLGALARRRLAREPVGRILGEVEFWGLPFRLAPEVLAPRPDTETVVEAALERSAGVEPPRRILDLGTGSGCILVALLSELPAAFGVGVDRSPDALRIAAANAARNGVGLRAGFAASDWAAALGTGFDLIVSNPPYIRTAEIAALDLDVSRYDPAAALDGGRDGLDAYRAILADSWRCLAPGGRLVLELGHDQAAAVEELGRAQGWRKEALRTDLAGHSRAIVLTR